jgi:hypothetical protein
LRKLIDDIKLWRHLVDEVEEEPCEQMLEPQTPDEDKVFLAMETGEGLPEDLPPLGPPANTSKPAASLRVANPYLKKPRRTAVEQAADISPMFRYVKKEFIDKLKKDEILEG